jgi:DNA repair protein RecO (recombination protein O)
MPSRERVYRTEAVVLRRQELGEADRLLTIYTPGHGKLRVVAKGVRRPRSRKAGHLELFSRGDLLLARGHDLDIVTQAEALDLFPGLRDDLVRLGHAAYAVEVLDCFAVAEENRPLYRLLVETLRRLSEGSEPAVVVRHFELRLLEHVGYRPELFLCVGCGREIRPENQFFSAREGGILCPQCGSERRDARPISLGALKVLRHFQRTPFAEVAGLRVSRAVQFELETLMEAYLTHVLERRLKTPAFLERVRALIPAVSPEAKAQREEVIGDQ